VLLSSNPLYLSTFKLYLHTLKKKHAQNITSLTPTTTNEPLTHVLTLLVIFLLFGLRSRASFLLGPSLLLWLGRRLQHKDREFMIKWWKERKAARRGVITPCVD